MGSTKSEAEQRCERCAFANLEKRVAALENSAG